MALSDSIPAVSILTQCGPYPSAESGFSPETRYPEYPFADLAGSKNPVYCAVRDVLRQQGLDAANFGTPQWNPLGEYVRPGARVFVLPNFVFHMRPSESRARFDAKCTHGSVLRALLDYVFIAAGPSARVSLGNASLQSCDWSRVTRDTGATAICSFYERHGLKPHLCDLRGLVRQEDVLGRSASIERRDADRDFRFDLGTESLLSGLDPGGPHYRVAGYDPAATASYHEKNHHIYVLNREIAEADVLISVPKLKTHEKVGITCALKGLVGTISQKECLAHHRFRLTAGGRRRVPQGGTNRTRIVEISRFRSVAPQWRMSPARHRNRGKDLGEDLFLRRRTWFWGLARERYGVADDAGYRQAGHIRHGGRQSTGHAGALPSRSCGWHHGRRSRGPIESRTRGLAHVDFQRQCRIGRLRGLPSDGL